MKNLKLDKLTQKGKKALEQIKQEAQHRLSKIRNKKNQK
jgi:DNA-binding PadR family transcriptional regulator